MPAEITDHESDLKVQEEDLVSANIEMMFKAFSLIIQELDGKVEHHELADGFLTVGLDMLRHMFEHAIPGDPEKVKTELREHMLSMLTHLEDGPWKPTE